MTLWIRTQEKNKITKVDEIRVEELAKNEYAVMCKGTGLGIYDTEKRALEIVDEIFNLLKSATMVFDEGECFLDKMNSNQWCQYINGYMLTAEGLNTINLNTLTYDMPEK